MCKRKPVWSSGASSKSEAWEGGKPSDALLAAKLVLNAFLMDRKTQRGTLEKGRGREILPRTILYQTYKDGHGSARRAPGDRWANPWRPRCLETSVFSKAAARIHEPRPQGHLHLPPEGAYGTNPNSYSAPLLARIPSTDGASYLALPLSLARAPYL